MPEIVASTYEIIEKIEKTAKFAKKCLKNFSKG